MFRNFDGFGFSCFVAAFFANVRFSYFVGFLINCGCCYFVGFGTNWFVVISMALAFHALPFF